MQTLIRFFEQETKVEINNEITVWMHTVEAEDLPSDVLRLVMRELNTTNTIRIVERDETSMSLIDRLPFVTDTTGLEINGTAQMIRFLEEVSGRTLTEADKEMLLTLDRTIAPCINLATCTIFNLFKKKVGHYPLILQCQVYIEGLWANRWKILGKMKDLNCSLDSYDSEFQKELTDLYKMSLMRLPSLHPLRKQVHFTEDIRGSTK